MKACHDTACHGNCCVPVPRCCHRCFVIPVHDQRTPSSFSSFAASFCAHRTKLVSGFDVRPKPSSSADPTSMPYLRSSNRASAVDATTCDCTTAPNVKSSMHVAMSEAAKIRHCATHAIASRCNVEQIISSKMVLCSLQTQAHQGASQASHLRLCPGGGGVSPNKMPFLSVRVPSLKKPGPLEDAFDRKLRSARTGTRDSDIAVGGAKDVQGLLLRGPQRGPLQRLHHLPCLKRVLLLETDAFERSEALQKWSGGFGQGSRFPR